MGHVVPTVELYFLSHGRKGVALTSLGAELRRDEVSNMSPYYALLNFWAVFRVVLGRFLLDLDCNSRVDVHSNLLNPNHHCSRHTCCTTHVRLISYHTYHYLHG